MSLRYACIRFPGKVTAETRKAWKLLGTLSVACPEVLDTEGRTKTKTEIRGITHLHHALDAVVVGLTHLYLPGILPGQMENEKGAIWRSMLKRNKNSDDEALLMATGMFSKHYRRNRDRAFELDDKGQKILDLHLDDIPKSVKNQITGRLAERRVVQHIPADRSDFDLEETTWRYLCDYDGQALLLQDVSRDSLKENTEIESFGWQDVPLKDGARKELKKILSDEAVLSCLHQNRINISRIQRGLTKVALEPHRSLVGLKEGKLKALKAVRVISHNANYGVSLGANPKLIPFHSVTKQLREIREENAGELPDIIRKGSIIKVDRGTWEGVWRVTSVKQSRAYGLSLDLVDPHTCRIGKNNAKIPNMLRDGLRICSLKLTGKF